MTKREKRIAKLKNTRGEAPFKLVGKVLQDHGYLLDHISGSHFIFIHKELNNLSIPVHSSKVKKCYIKVVINTLKL